MSGLRHPPLTDAAGSGKGAGVGPGALPDHEPVCDDEHCATVDPLIPLLDGTHLCHEHFEERHAGPGTDDHDDALDRRMGM